MKCSGCGAVLQNKESSKPGYTPRKEFTASDLCKRCYRLIHHNESPDSHYTNKDFLNILRQVESENCLVIYLLDFFDFIGSNITEVERVIQNKDHIIVANKIDLMPKAVKEAKLRRWFQKEVNMRNFDPLDVLLISAKKKRNIDELLNLIDQYRNGRNVYVVGATNTGKSTLINGIISAVTGDNRQVITTSYFAGTTLSTIQIPFDDGTYLVDTPGIINEHQITNYLNKESLDIIVANSEIRPETYQLNPDQVLFITGLVRMRYLNGPKTSFTLYFSNRVQVHRAKLEREAELLEKHLGKELLSPPSQQELERIDSFESQEFTLYEGKQDIVIEGFGWITLNDIADDVTIEIVYPEKTRVHVRDSII